MKLIDKATVVAEIQRIMAEEISFFKDCCEDELENTSSPAVYTRMKMLLSFLNTLEVKDIDEIIKNAEDHAYFAGSEAMRWKLIDKACKWLREGGTGWYLTSESGGDEINFVKLAEDFRKAMEGE